VATLLTQVESIRSPTVIPSPRRTAKKRVRIIKKIRTASGFWKFISLDRIGNRYVWDKRPGHYFLEWWDGKSRRRELAGQTPSEVLEAQRRKQNELVGELLMQGRAAPSIEEIAATKIADAITMFVEHVKAHSPGKPETVRRYQQVLDHFEDVLGHKKYVEAITRADIDDYKIKRSVQDSERTKRPATPRTVNFEVSTLRTFFYYLINERGVPMKNPCARFKALKDEKKKANRKPPTYSQDDINKLFAACDEFEKTILATLMLTGLRKRELYYLTWKDVDLKRATIRVTGEGKEGFSPKDYEERPVPIPPDLVALLKKLPRTAEWVFPNPTGGRMNHLLRRLKAVAETAKVEHATLHKFRHTYATRLLEQGCDIVTLQNLMGHSDLDTTRQYLNPDDTLKRAAVNRLTLPA
jgi:integrase/recombinase XerD